MDNIINNTWPAKFQHERLFESQIAAGMLIMRTALADKRSMTGHCLCSSAIMKKAMSLAALLAFCSIILAANANEYLLTTASLPSDLNFMPSLGNGHLGYTVFGDAIYVNGVYNGYGGDSRRARLPNWLNLTASIETHTPTAVVYKMHLLHGYFEWQQTYSDLGLVITQRSYAHRYYNRALVYELVLHAAEGLKSDLRMKLELLPGNVSDAFVFTVIPQSKYKLLKATTKLIENGQFQLKPSVVHVAFSEPIADAKYFALAKGQKSLQYRYILSIDHSEAGALKELEAVLALSDSALHRAHSEMWLSFWQNFNITLKSNRELSAIINAGIFYMASSLPSPQSNQANHAYGGLSPTGLGRGQLDDDYEGHNFWDTEIWMLPVVTQFSIDWAKQLLGYRRQHLPGAIYNANMTGYPGARFPWESAFTGTEVTNPCCPEVAQQQIHITADIAFALRQYYAITNNAEWLCHDAWPILKEIVVFLESRVTWHVATDSYHIKDVMGPDEDHVHVDDNVYTNYVFKIAFEFADFTSKKCTKVTTPNNWLSIARKLVILYDAKLDYHPQYLGYQQPTEIKQADAILLGYPLQFQMNDSTRLHDLHTYAEVTRPSGPAMTWSMFAINFLAIGELSHAEKYFERSYANYVRPHFKVWSEVALDFKGSANFLTGVGGFLQAVLNGYAGLRFYHDADKSVMEIGNKYLLPNERYGWQINGIKFGDAIFQLDIYADNKGLLSCVELGSKRLLLKQQDKEEFEVQAGFQMLLEHGKVLVETL